MAMMTPEYSLENASTRDLVQEVVKEARELVALEVKLAKADLQEDARRLRNAAIGFGVAAAFALLTLSTLALTAVLALGASVWVALAFTGGFLVAGGIAGALAYSSLPKRPLERTRGRLKHDIVELKEHVV